MENKVSPMPDVVNFRSGGVDCIAAVCFGTQYLLNMRICTINFKSKPKVEIEYLPHSARVIINDGDIWFDVDGESAAKIEQLFQSGS